MDKFGINRLRKIKEVPLDGRARNPITLNEVIRQQLSRNYSWFIDEVDILSNEGNKFNFECEYTGLNELKKCKGVYTDISNSIIGVDYYFIIDKNSIGHLDFTIEVQGKETIKSESNKNDASVRFRVKKQEEG